MTGSHGLLAFTVAVGILTVIPGVDTMLVMRNVIQRDRLAGVKTALGACSGVFVHATFSALGLSLILTKSAEVYAVVKLVGAVYLAGLGIWTIISAWRSRDLETAPSRTKNVGSLGSGKSYVEGLLGNILNPKAAVFYLAFLPQFIAPGEPVLAKSLMLASIHFVMATAWLSVVAFAVGQFSGWLTRPNVKRRMEYASGLIIGAFGLRLALDR